MKDRHGVDDDQAGPEPSRRRAPTAPRAGWRQRSHSAAAHDSVAAAIDPRTASVAHVMTSPDVFGRKIGTVMDSTRLHPVPPTCRSQSRGTIAPTRLSAAYRLGLVVVAMAMLLLPLVYLGLIVLAGLAVWWHLTANLWILEGRSGGFWKILAYLGPAVAGVVVVFFLVKPVLARPERRREPVPLDRDAEPVLFAFIEQICRQVRAPVPRRVQVDCQVNASAGFLPRPLGLLRRDLVLTIGLPLVAGLSVRELGGVLAHEFGHFAQGGGMRLTALVRGINGWFGRVVYERDQWDDELERWASGDGSDWRLDHRAARGASVDLGIPPRADRPDDRRARDQLLHAPADGVRRRQLRSQVRRQRCVCTDVDAHARARARDAAWLR